MGIGTMLLLAGAVAVIGALSQSGKRQRGGNRRGRQGRRERTPRNKKEPTMFRLPHIQLRSAPPDIPFIRRPLMTPTEFKFFHILNEAFPECMVCPQVALAAVVDIPAHFNKGKFKYVNRAPFASKFADFTVLDPMSGEVYAIIELDDYTHDSAEKKAEDAERDAMLEEVGIPVHRFDARRMPTVPQVQAHFGA